MRAAFRFLIGPALVALALLASAWAQVPVPELRAPVTDLTGTLTSEQVAALDQRLRAFKAAKGSQISLLLVPTTAPETIEQYSIRVAEAWQLGRRGVNEGVLVLVAKNDRAVRIEVGHGLEGALPDVIAHRIADQVIVPRFRSGDFYGGLSEGITRIVAVIENEPLPAPEPERSVRRGRDGTGFMVPLLFFVLIAAGGLRRVVGAFGAASVSAGIAAVVVWILTNALAITIGAAVVAFLFTLLGGGGGGGWTSRRRGGWGGGWIGGGGFGGGGFGGGGGGGGWSGGGGTFGGGGATGRW